ncbi:hypothetical protein B0H14DRAFT_3127895 [Mycena olivaceomarginata]|nr:hypothetical protein B0H14DRAFT_3127895 [Mycena olivaceomarginata]
MVVLVEQVKDRGSQSTTAPSISQTLMQLILKLINRFKGLQSIKEKLANHITTQHKFTDQSKSLCAPGTRAEIQADILKWLSPHPSANERIFWITGIAGSGKSTLSATVVDNLRQKGTPVAAQFFISRNIPETINPAKMIATIGQQLAESSPVAAHIIHEKLKDGFPPSRDEQLEDLYRLILTSFENIDDPAQDADWRENQLHGFRHVIGTILVLDEPLTIGQITALLADIPEDDFDITNFLQQMRSVLIPGTTTSFEKATPQIHKSFRDYIMGGHAPAEFRIFTGHAHFPGSQSNVVIKYSVGHWHKHLQKAVEAGTTWEDESMWNLFGQMVENAGVSTWAATDLVNLFADVAAVGWELLKQNTNIEKVQGISRILMKAKGCAYFSPVAHVCLAHFFLPSHLQGIVRPCIPSITTHITFSPCSPIQTFGMRTFFTLGKAVNSSPFTDRMKAWFPLTMNFNDELNLRPSTGNKTHRAILHVLGNTYVLKLLYLYWGSAMHMCLMAIT